MRPTLGNGEKKVFSAFRCAVRRGVQAEVYFVGGAEFCWGDMCCVDVTYDFFASGVGGWRVVCVVGWLDDGDDGEWATQLGAG